MKIIRLAGNINSTTLEETKINRRKRAKLLYRLFLEGYNIYNGNGDQKITLGNAHKKIIESEGFIFTPRATVSDLFLLSSIIVGFQTHDKYLDNKPLILMNHDNVWDEFIALLEHLNQLGTVHQKPTELLSLADKAREAIDILSSMEPSITVEDENATHPSYHETYDTASGVARPARNVCVFCSASIKDEYMLEQGYQLGKMLAENNIGCVSGAGRTGIMGKVVAGSVENRGWAGGSNIPHIIELEGLPDGLHEFWAREDIYTRMEVMIEESDDFIIMPGGVGTLQELFALLMFKRQDNPLMRNKDIVIVNINDFWSPLLPILESFNTQDMYKVVSNIEEIMPILG